MRVAVDRSACCGYAVCTEICPQMFRLGDDSIAVVDDPVVPEELQKTARMAVDSCPQSALSIEYH
jgi:ferredoxin